MSIKTVAQCDYCPKIRDPEKNHWSLIFADANYFTVTVWDDTRSTEAHGHACSDECVKTALTAHLSRIRDARAAEDSNSALEKTLLAQKHDKLQDKAVTA